ncbi:MAG: WXG100 family type VII secretion target [Defluviitaleaceae bacterium]|nr:WXG100 family type VII secretion target [Defluviitaleaceae bacterium]
MIATDIEKTRNDAAQLRELSESVGAIAISVKTSRNEHSATWKGNAGNAFHELSGRLYTQISSFEDELKSVSDDILQICAKIEAAEKK